MAGALRKEEYMLGEDINADDIPGLENRTSNINASILFPAGAEVADIYAALKPEDKDKLRALAEAELVFNRGEKLVTSAGALDDLLNEISSRG